MCVALLYMVESRRQKESPSHIPLVGAVGWLGGEHVEDWERNQTLARL